MKSLLSLLLFWVDIMLCIHARFSISNSDCSATFSCPLWFLTYFYQGNEQIYHGPQVCTQLKKWKALNIMRNVLYTFNKKSNQLWPNIYLQRYLSFTFHCTTTLTVSDRNMSLEDYHWIQFGCHPLIPAPYCLFSHTNIITFCFSCLSLTGYFHSEDIF